MTRRILAQRCSWSKFNHYEIMYCCLFNLAIWSLRRKIAIIHISHTISWWSKYKFVPEDFFISIRYQNLSGAIYITNYSMVYSNCSVSWMLYPGLDILISIALWCGTIWLLTNRQWWLLSVEITDLNNGNLRCPRHSNFILIQYAWYIQHTWTIFRKKSCSLTLIKHQCTQHPPYIISRKIA